MLHHHEGTLLYTACLIALWPNFSIAAEWRKGLGQSGGARLPPLLTALIHAWDHAGKGKKGETSFKRLVLLPVRKISIGTFYLAYLGVPEKS